MRLQQTVDSLFHHGYVTARTDIPRRTDIDAPINYRQNKHTLFGQREGLCTGCKGDSPFKLFEVDHVIPQSRGGTDHLDNPQLLCSSCNRIKGPAPGVPGGKAGGDWSVREMDWSTIVVSIISVVGAAVVGYIGWFIRSRAEVAQRERERFQDERRKVYLNNLETSIRLLTGINNPPEMDKAKKRILSFEHRQSMVDITLMRPDDVVNAVNDVQEQAYRQQDDGREVVKALGRLLLAIRKDLGNKNTKLTDKDMLRSHITDIDQLYRDADRIEG